MRGITIVHVRKAVLGSRPPAANRDIPPLRDDIAQLMKEDFPDMPLLLNGGLKIAETCVSTLE
jgi:tRNA-dihydrouridine synthase A